MENQAKIIGMKKIILDAYSEAKKISTTLWIAAIVVPCGIMAVTVYIAGKTAYNNHKKKEQKDDRSENSSR